jgi:hypothetical protein
MTLYVKGFKIDRRKVAGIIEATRTNELVVHAGIRPCSRGAIEPRSLGWARDMSDI